MRILLASEILPGTIMLPILHCYNKLITDSEFIIICIYPYVNWKPKHTILLSLYLVGMASKFLRFLTHPKKWIYPYLLLTCGDYFSCILHKNMGV